MRPSTLSVTAMVSGLALAQNSTNSTTTPVCPNQRWINNTATGSINSTGISSFTFNSTTGSGTTKPWYVSIQVNNSASSGNGGTIAWPYLSVPEDTDADVCIYTFGSRNATPTGDNCEGVFPDKCIDYLREAVRNASSGLGGGRARCDLPNTAEQNGRQWDACGPMGSRSVAREFFPFLPLFVPRRF